MAERIFCDKCKKEIGTPEESPFFQVAVHPMGPGDFKNHIELDFCPGCVPPELLTLGKLVDNPI